MQSQLRDVIDACSALLAQADELSGIADELTNARAALAATKAEHEAVKVKLADDWSLLEAKQREALQAHDRAIFEKAQTLRQMQMQHDTARSNLSALQAAVGASKQEYDAIQASLSEIKRRFAR
jgi:hypothetical protein